MSKISILCPFSSRFRPFTEHHHPTQPHFHNCFKRQRGGWRASLNAGSFSCDQAALWMVQSVRPSIHLSVCCHTLFTLFPLSFHQSLMWLREVPYCFLRSSFKRSRKTKIVDFDPNWAFLDCKSSLNSPMVTKIVKWDRRGALFLFKIIHKIQGHTGQKIAAFDPNWAFLDCNYSLKSPMALKRHIKLGAVLKSCAIVFQNNP